jgi:hypothetical protein
MTRGIVYASILAGTAALVYGLATSEYLIPAIGIALLGLIWIIATTRKLLWGTASAFGIFTFISVVSIWGGVSAWLSLACVICSLVVWDLTKFSRRLNMTKALDDRRKMERGHFIHLGLVIGVSILGFAATTSLRITLTFGGAVVLALLAAWGIGALVYRLRRHEDEVDV